MFVQARKDRGGWTLSNCWEHSFYLPCQPDYSESEVLIGVVGTRAEVRVPRALARTRAELMARMFAALPQLAPSPCLYLLDVRRDGVGAQSSWSPREFASLIPEMLGERVTYAYYHLPCLAPRLQHLADFRREARTGGEQAAWRTFRDRYLAELAPEALAIGRAFVEAAAAVAGMAVFLCAEAHQPFWDKLSPAEKDAHYCHRFTLAAQLAASMKADYANLSVKRVDFDMADFVAQWTHSRSHHRSVPPVYLPSVTPL